MLFSSTQSPIPPNALCWSKQIQLQDPNLIEGLTTGLDRY